MPIAKVKLPDGRIGRFSVPEGTTPEQVLEFARQQNLDLPKPVQAAPMGLNRQSRPVNPPVEGAGLSDAAVLAELPGAAGEALLKTGRDAIKSMGNREFYRAAGATVGSVPGTLMAATPAAPAAFPTLIGGAALGSAAGDYAYDLAQTLMGKPVGTPKEQAVRAAGGAIDEATLNAGLGVAGQVLRSAKPAIGKIAGALTPEAKTLKAKADVLGVPLGAIDVTESPATKGYAKVIGVFPFVGTPIKREAARKQQLLASRADDILNNIAPNATLNDMGVEIVNRAEKGFSRFKKEASKRYDRFYSLADNASVKDIVPTSSIKQAAQELSDVAGRDAITLQTGENLKGLEGDPLQDFINQLPELPDKITAPQARKLQKDLNAAARKASADGWDVSRLSGIKRALEKDFYSPDVAALPADEAKKIISAAKSANEFYAKGMQRFNTATANKFGSFDRRMFEAGAKEAGTLNPDEAFKRVFNAKSPQGLDDLRSLVGDDTFRMASRKYLETAFDNALETRKTMTGRPGASWFNGEKFARNIGINTPEGDASLQVMLEGSGVSLRKFKDFIEVAQAASGVVPADVSSFVARRATLGGAAALTGAFTAGQKMTDSKIKAIGLGLLGRNMSKILASPKSLDDMTKALSPNVKRTARDAALLRLLSYEGEE